MKTVWKFPLTLQSSQRVSLPGGAQVLSVQSQGDRPVLYALVDPDSPPRRVNVRVCGTGHLISDADAGALRYVGTVSTDGAFWWHVFVEEEQQQ